MPMNLVLVDDHPLMLAGLEQLLRAEPEFEILATCSSVAEGWDAVTRYQPDVVILDLKLGEGDGLSLLSRLKPGERPAVVVLTAAEDENIWLKAAQLGATRRRAQGDGTACDRGLPPRSTSRRDMAHRGRDRFVGAAGAAQSG